jgi:hypothetical protein
MTEKRSIEEYTATYLLPFLNAAFQTDYRIFEVADAPDVLLISSKGEKAGIEATIVDDREGDIAHQLGRRATRRASRSGLPGGADFSGGEPLTRLVERIKDKLTKDYGLPCALAVRQTSPIEWDWAVHLAEIRQRLESEPQPYKLGVWIIPLSGAEVVRVF